MTELRAGGILIILYYNTKQTSKGQDYHFEKLTSLLRDFFLKCSKFDSMKKTYYFQQQKCFQMSSIKSSQALFRFQSENNTDQNYKDYMKYLVIDSENEDQVISKKRSFSIANPDTIPQEKKSLIFRSKRSSVSNFQSDSDPYIDGQVFTAQEEIDSLKKQCELLQKMIADMIEEQAKLKVAERRRERRNTDKKQAKHNMVSQGKANCEKCHLPVRKEIIKCNQLQIQKNENSNIFTPFASKNAEKTRKPSLQIMKTVQIKNTINQLKRTGNKQNQIVLLQPKTVQKKKQFEKIEKNIIKARRKVSKGSNKMI